MEIVSDKIVYMCYDHMCTVVYIQGGWGEDIEMFLQHKEKKYINFHLLFFLYSTVRALGL